MLIWSYTIGSLGIIISLVFVKKKELNKGFWICIVSLLIFGVGNFNLNSLINFNNSFNQMQDELNLLEASIDKIYSEKIVTQDGLRITSKSNKRSSFDAGVIINNFNSEKNIGDTQIKGSSDPNTLYIKAASNNVGIGTNNPKTKLEIFGDISIKDVVTGGNPGKQLCLDSNNTICICDQCF